MALLAMMALGAALPQFQSLSFLIQYVLMLMLFLAFLDIEFSPGSFQIGVLWVLLANLAVAWLGYWLFASTDLTLALAAFMTGIAPTAIASPVIIGFIHGRVEYMIGAVLLTNVATALVIPFALPLLLGAQVHISVWQILQPVLLVMFVPLALARLTAWLPSSAQTFARAGKRFSFPLWLFNLFLISARAAYFIRHENPGSFNALLQIALVSLLICAVNFGLGALIGGRRDWQESSQALGQKNNSFVIWIALTFINPLVAMGPVFYILYHNLYNSFQIYLFEKRRTRA
jgi:BASS family bile acid:Na+ symporter